MSAKTILRILGFKMMDPPPPPWREYRHAKIAMKNLDDELWILADANGYEYLGRLFLALSKQAEGQFDHQHLGPELELTEGSLPVVISRWREDV